jgi:hypothetical protein
MPSPRHPFQSAIAPEIMRDFRATSFWTLRVERLDDEQLETRMYGPRDGKRDGRPEPDLPYLT